MEIAFVYADGRLNRLREKKNNPDAVPSDFFYGALELEREGHAILHDEIHESKAPRLLRFLDHRLGLGFPVRFSISHFYLCLAHLKKWNRCDCIVSTNSRAGMSLGLLKKIGCLRPPVATIHCGIVNCKHTKWRRRLTVPLLRQQEIILFADAEREEMQKVFEVDPRRFHICDFGVDTAFWSETDVIGEYAFAVGNDGRRDFETFIEAATFNTFPHQLLTRIPIKTPAPQNLIHRKGGWQNIAISDQQLRDLYHHSRCVVVPLQDSPQPSGQSVALQAMSCARPVIMTRTQGFWWHPDFKDGEHLLFVPPNDAKALAEKIRFLMENPAEAQRIGQAGRTLMLRHYSIENFAKGVHQACRFAMHQAPSS